MGAMYHHKVSMGPQHKDECHQCGEPMTSWKEYQEHVQNSHEGIWMFKCGICDQLFDDQTSRVSHRRSHSDESKALVLELIHILVSWLALALKCYQWNSWGWQSQFVLTSCQLLSSDDILPIYRFQNLLWYLWKICHKSVCTHGF